MFNSKMIGTNSAGILPPEPSFGVLTWSGNGANNRTISGLNFTPSLVIISRDDIYGTTLYSKSFSTANAGIQWGSRGAQTANNYFAGYVDGGIIVGSAGTAPGTLGNNSNGVQYVAWCWDAGHTSLPNTDGNVTNNLYSNPNAGISTGLYNSSAGGTPTIGHGLNSAPSLVFIKTADVSTTATYGHFWHSGLNRGDSSLYAISWRDNLTEQTGGGANYLTYPDNIPTDSVFYPKPNQLAVYQGTTNYMNFSFSQIENFSHFGHFVRTASEIQVDLPFQPDFVMIKSTEDASRDWTVVDSVRGNNVLLSPFSTPLNQSKFELNANGFVVDSNVTSANINYIYLAFRIN